ncbi:MAG: hypothetical protein NZ846_00815 [Thermus sp.]|uniref:hypothetical protein n=1 Tax=Thermus sp. TaxID=275 RepID=UPI0025EB2AB9|nr:hypothetical protein [Thermus sp.]MCS7217517.1 hypothetical protein [Thermus sp.]
MYRGDTQTPVDLNNVGGRVIVRAKVALGSVVPDKIQFLLDDSVEYEVNFGTATQGVRPQQATFTFEWNLNTAALNNQAPKYRNGPHSVRVRLVRGGQAIATSAATNVVFNNADFAIFKFSGNALNAGGNRYYGGGEVSIEVIPVLYSGRTVASVRFEVPPPSGVDLDPASGVQNTRTLTSAPYVFPIPYNAHNRSLPALNGSSGATNPYTYFTITYSDTTTLPSNSDVVVLDGNQVLIDTTGLFSNQPVLGNTISAFAKIRVDYVVDNPGGPAIACRGTTPLATGQFATGGNVRAGVTTLGPDAGAGGYKLVVDVRTTLGQTILSNAEVNISGGGCAAAGALSGLGEGGFYQVVAKELKDNLGNTRTLGSFASSNAFGIDNTKPTLALKTNRASNVFFNTAIVSGPMAGGDTNDNSIPAAADLTAQANVNDPAAGTPPVASGIAGYVWQVNGQTITGHTVSGFPTLGQIQTTLSQPAPTQNYYTLTVQAQDNAGNTSDPLTFTALYDDQAPNVVFTQPTVTSLTGGATFTATARGTDNVDLRRGRIYWSITNNTDNIRLEVFRSPDKSFGTPATTSQDYSVNLRALRPASNIGNPPPYPFSIGLFAFVEDQARNAPATALLNPLSVTPANANTAGAVTAVSETPAITGASGGSTTLTITHAGGTANVVAVRVYRYNPGIALGGFRYYDFLGDAASLGGGEYRLTVTLPALPSHLLPGAAELFILVEYDNGLARGFTYNYDTDTPTSIF